MKFKLDIQRRGFRIAIKNFIKRIKVRFGWRYCSKCRQLMKLRWVKDWIYHPEEPPLFYHFECPKCGVHSDIIPSTLTTKAVRNLGYEDFNDFAKKVLKK